MAIKFLQGVTYQGGLPGQAFGGGIYGATVTIGNSQTPTKISLNIVKEWSDAVGSAYPINNSHLDVSKGSEKVITIGGKVFPDMYLYSYSISTNSNAKTLTVDFVDKSLMLDKIFVGLIQRHAMGLATSYGGGGRVTGPWDDRFGRSKGRWEVRRAKFSVSCWECPETALANGRDPINDAWRVRYHFPADPSIIEPSTGVGQQQPPNTVERFVCEAGASGANFHEDTDGIDGGYVIMGKEQFTETNCDLASVDYSFEELCDALTAILARAGGGSHNFANFDRTKGKQKEYRQNYIGTLREVLNNWGADYGFDFFFDGADLVGYDLSAGIDLTPVRNAINAGFRKGNADLSLIEGMSESYSLENTYKQNIIARYTSPPNTRDISFTHQVYKEGEVMSIFDAVGNTCLYGRPTGVFLKCTALAKYHPASRLIYLTDYALKDTGAFVSLGFFPMKEIRDPGQKDNLCQQTAIGPGRGNQAKDAHPIWANPDNYRIFMGIWSKEHQEAMLTYDKDVSDFYGKFGF